MEKVGEAQASEMWLWIRPGSGTVLSPPDGFDRAAVRRLGASA
ncbi:hypothetical protein ABUE34_15770 (plasmid) [Kozakia baliensis]